MKSSPRPVYAVVLAAGESLRCAPDNKLFLPWGQSVVLEAVVSSVLASQVEATAVVTGHQAERVSQFLKRFSCRVVFNPDYRSGMGTSLVAGLDYWLSRPGISPAAGFLVVLGDQPSIAPAIIDRVLAAYRESAAEIVVPVCRGRRGHPPVFHRSLIGEIRQVAGRFGARELLRRHPEKIHPVEVGGEEILRDIDTPEDYHRLAEAALGGPAPVENHPGGKKIPGPP